MPACMRERSRSPRLLDRCTSGSRLSKGDAVHFFFQADVADFDALYLQPQGQSDGGPELLQSHGWLVGSLLEDFDPERFDEKRRETWALVTPAPELRFKCRPGRESSGDVFVKPLRVRPDDLCQRAPALLLSAVFVRRTCGESVPETCGRYGSPIDDTYIAGFMERGVQSHPALARKPAEHVQGFEAFSLFVADAAEVDKIGALTNLSWDMLES
eukprot:TRINITY_DN32425_c0_g1_i1.p1 TRINITY_DN32425_c0_g1~~TRINITY_DN32425_c0_g1_i1.p1  ORF type:complete len:230 (-),score=19.25 TRINITY_DN32425_c0_g1_i1:179-820(-)